MRSDEKAQTGISDLSFNENSSLRCQLPHSTGDLTSDAEILYFLEARVTMGGVFKHVMKRSRQIFLYPITNPHQPPRSIINQREIAFNRTENHEKVTSIYGVAIELGQGGDLALGQRVPIKVHVTQSDLSNLDDLILNDYQVMLIQRTITRVGTRSQVKHVFRTLRTVSNLNLDICVAEITSNNAMTLSDNSWGPTFLPSDITPTFETCNITRTYKLEVRLGFKGGARQVSSVLHMFQKSLRLF